MSAKRTLISELAQHNGQEVTLKGWLNNLRAIGEYQSPMTPIPIPSFTIFFLNVILK